MKQRIIRTIQSEKGEASYISTFIYILVVVIMIAFIINVFQIISVKQQMDYMADQLVKQIQLNGNTDSLFSYLAGRFSGVEGLAYEVDSPDDTEEIQIGTPFYVSVSDRCYLGGFWKLRLIPITIRASGAGVSEHYWKSR